MVDGHETETPQHRRAAASCPRAGIALGPGKADLLEAIAATGSISAAGRKLKMSYRRAWLLVEELNGSFQSAWWPRTKGEPMAAARA